MSYMKRFELNVGPIPNGFPLAAVIRSAVSSHPLASTWFFWSDDVTAPLPSGSFTFLLTSLGGDDKGITKVVSEVEKLVKSLVTAELQVFKENGVASPSRPQPPQRKSPENGMTQKEIRQLVNRYIGVEAGYLGDFSYQSHEDFYPEFCNLTFDTKSMPGTTRERFIRILEDSDPTDQGKIVRGVLEKYPVSSFSEDEQDVKEGLRETFETVAERLESGSAPSVGSLELGTTSFEGVSAALEDAEVLLRERGPASAIDRVHTALHGYLRHVAQESGFDQDGASLPRLYKLLRKNHPAFKAEGPHTEAIERVAGSMAGAVDALNTLRNNATSAHPAEKILDDVDAHLAMNAAKTLLTYVRDRLQASGPESSKTGNDGIPF